VRYNANILQISSIPPNENAKGAYATLIDTYYLRLAIPMTKAVLHNHALHFRLRLSKLRKEPYASRLAEEWTMDDPQVVEILAQTNTDNVLTHHPLTLDGEQPYLQLPLSCQSLAGAGPTVTGPGLLPCRKTDQGYRHGGSGDCHVGHCHGYRCSTAGASQIIDLTEASQKLRPGSGWRAPVETHDEIGLLQTLSIP
jgi:hypothetical protein